MSTGVHSKAAPAGNQHADGPRLLADIGGTNARFALETAPGEIGQIRVYPGADYPGIAEVDAAVSEGHEGRPRQPCGDRDRESGRRRSRRR